MVLTKGTITKARFPRSQNNMVLVVETIGREWPRYCRKVYWTKVVQNGPNEHLVKMALFRTGFQHSRMVHFGLKRSILFH